MSLSTKYFFRIHINIAPKYSPEKIRKISREPYSRQNRKNNKTKLPPRRSLKNPPPNQSGAGFPPAPLISAYQSLWLTRLITATPPLLFLKLEHYRSDLPPPLFLKLEHYRSDLPPSLFQKLERYRSEVRIDPEAGSRRTAAVRH